jgi:hypothetical protein
VGISDKAAFYAAFMPLAAENLESLLNVVIADKHLQMFFNRVAIAVALTLATGQRVLQRRRWFSATTV